MNFKNPINYVKGEVVEQTYLNYVKKNGIFKVKINKIFGTESEDGRSSSARFDLQIVGTEDLLSCKELLTYTDKSTGQEKETKGMHLIRAVIGMVSGKTSASMKWSKSKEKNNFTQETIEGHELKKLEGKIINVRVQVERSIYNDKAYEKNTIQKIFNEEGLSLAEYEAEEQEPKAIVKLRTKALKYRYSKCTKEEWNDINDDGNEVEATSSDETVDEALPSIVPATVEIVTPTEVQAVEPTVEIVEPTVEIVTPTEVVEPSATPQTIPTLNL